MTEALALGPIRVRAGLHTGTPLLAEEGYVGDDVHRAARIAAAGHGGQVLVSRATASLVEIELTDLGEHRFKDLSAPERVYQLGDGAFPALKSLYRTNLPVPATSFLGREREVAEIAQLLQDGARLLTLTGPGGTGKTRLAIHSAAEAADSFPDGIWWVPLSSLRDANLLVSSVAQALGMEEQPGRELAESVEARLVGKQALLILDNAEHLMPEIATGIAALRDIEGPTVARHEPRAAPAPGRARVLGAVAREEDGIELFLPVRGRWAPGSESPRPWPSSARASTTFRLAIELAAARTVVFSPEQLVDRLSQRLDLLKAGRDADPRQQTLRATIEWSYDLLESEEQRLFRALSVFAGGCNVRGSRGGLRRRPGHAPVAARQEPGPAARRGRRPALLDARDDPRAGGRTARERQARTRSSGASTPSTTWRSHARRTSLRTSRGSSATTSSSPSATTCEPHSPGRLETADQTLGLELFVALENYWATACPEEGLEWAVTLLAGAAAGDVDPGLVARALAFRAACRTSLGQVDESDASWERALTIVASAR